MQTIRSKYIACAIATATCCSAATSTALSQDHAKPTPLWQQYSKQGEKAYRHGDPTLAKRYLLGALTELEKTKPTRGTPLSGSVSRLEKRLLDIYPQEWTIDENNPSAQLALQEEQVNVFGRINKLASSFSNENQLTQKVVETRYRDAYAALQKTRAAVAAKKSGDRKISTK